MDEPRLRVVRSDGTGTSEPTNDQAPPDVAPPGADQGAEENPWTAAFRAERSGHPSLRRPVPERAEGPRSAGRMRAYLHLVEGP
jgi:hypothetical protein